MVTKPNKTGNSTAADLVMTPPKIARILVSSFPIQGTVLEPCAGTGHILEQLLKLKTIRVLDDCEINSGSDFFDYWTKVDWIVTNPPYSIYDRFLEHAFKCANNVLLLVPLAKAFKSMGTENLISKFGGLKEIHLVGSGTKCGFSFGFPTGFLWYKRNYKVKITYKKIK